MKPLRICLKVVNKPVLLLCLYYNFTYLSIELYQLKQKL